MLRKLPVLALLGHPFAELPSPVVTTASGKVRGVCEKQGICRFLGIPYAAPPVGDLRWRPPQLPEPWTGVRDATHFGEDCPQFLHGKVTGNESCLFLNVWAPSTAQCPSASCAVMFWIHGGCYETGGTKTEYNGERLAALGENVVVVTVNYRLNVLGFLGSDALRSRDNSGGSTGNYGIQDQRVALEWVQQNIAQFGGDRGNVMIFGESAGAGSVSVHLATPSSWPLYHKAALESGAYSYWVARPMQTAEQQYRSLLGITGCGGPRCLLALEERALLEFSGRLATMVGCVFSPTVDGVELVQPPWDLLEQGRVNTRVPLLLGHNKDEGTIDLKGAAFQKGFNMTRADFESLLAPSIGRERVPEALEIYGAGVPGGDPDYANWYWSATRFRGDYMYSCPTRRTARAFNHQGKQKVFYYYFSHVPEAPQPSWAGLPGQKRTAGSCHAAEVPFVWLTLRGPDRIRSRELQLAVAIASYWTNFARHSDPNARAPPATNLTIPWSSFSSEDEVSIQLDLPSLSTMQGRLNRQCDFIDPLGQLNLSTSPWLGPPSDWPGAADRGSALTEQLLI